MNPKDFESLVRAEAQREHPLTADLSGIEYAKQMGRREAVIDTRIKREWPLLEALQMILSEHPPHRDGMDDIPLPFGIKRGRDALTPYAIKPTE